MRGRACAPAVVIALSLLGCTAVDEPRWSETSSARAASEVRSFPSPRVIYEVESSPDIGEATFSGILFGRDRTTVVAPADGVVSDTQFRWGEQVDEGTAVLTFLPSASEAELLEVEIATLEVDRAVLAGADDDAVAEAQLAVDALEAALVDRTEVVESPASGVIGSTRPNITYRVDEGDMLFQISDPSDLIIEIRMPSSDLAFVRPGMPVVINPDTDALAGRVETVPADDASVATVLVTVVIEEDHDLDLGSRVSVLVAGQVDDGTVWIPLEFLHRQRSESFLLRADSEGRLVRVSGDLGRQTLTHVEVRSGLEVGAQVVAPS